MNEPPAIPPVSTPNAFHPQEPEDEALLAAQSAELMETILRRAGMKRIEPELLRLETMVRYLSGALAPAEIAAADRALARYAANRAELRRTLTELRSLQSLSWEQAGMRAQLENPAGEVARAWLKILAERAQTLPGALERQRSRPWTELRREVTEGLAQAQAAWSAFLAFGQQALAERAHPRLALVKSAASEAPAWNPPNNLSANPFFLNARITNDRGLMVELNLADLEADALVQLVGQTAHVSMRIQGEAWHLGGICISPQGGRLVVPEFGAVLDLPSGTLPAHWFALALQAPFTPPQGEPVILQAEVWEREGRSSSLPPAPVEVAPLLAWEEGALVLQVKLPRMVQGMYADYILEFDLMVMAPHAQYLGAWPVREWGEEPRVLRVPCPGNATNAALPASLLRARLRPPAPPQ